MKSADAFGHLPKGPWHSKGRVSLEYPSARVWGMTLLLLVIAVFDPEPTNTKMRSEHIYICIIYVYIYIYLVQHHPASKTMVDQGINGRSPIDVGGALHWMVLFPKPTGFCGKGHERTCTSQCGLTVARKFAKNIQKRRNSRVL